MKLELEDAMERSACGRECPSHVLTTHRHNMKSYQFAFLLLCMMWALLRALYFLMVTPSNQESGWLMVIFWCVAEFALSATEVNTRKKARTMSQMRRELGGGART